MSDRDVAQIRFGYGLGPPAQALTRAEMWAQLAGPDRVAMRFPVVSLSEALSLGRTFRETNRAVREGVTGAEARYEAARVALRNAGATALQATFARIAEADAPLRERLTWFWADHFAVVPNDPLTRAAAGAYVDEAIRPNITAPFADMLKAVVRHPMMLVYLDQHVSIGPNSPAGARTGRGLNENFARELLELHTLGAGADYGQADVRQAAELLTGLSIDPEDGFVFRPFAAEPGAETVLGTRYGAEGRARLSDIDAFLEDLATRPDTARHLARKLAVHFSADTPPEPLVAALEARYRETGGDLGAVTQALLDHPSTADLRLQKAKTPMDFIGSTMVALGMSGEAVAGLTRRELGNFLARPMAGMGQTFMRPLGPDGWPEEAAHWITPQGLATRINWAVAVAERTADRITDPRAFLATTLGALVGDRLRFAVGAAETRAEGIALTLASAEFNRR